MALIPGSYARAAGLQSEINKVTVTRVAGSEVQFRRTIDTYQRDLRYHVNQIGREQKQLKRSMRKYSKKLRDSRKEQKARKAKVREDSQRLKHHAQSFSQAEHALRQATWTVPKAEGGDDSHASETEQETTHISDSSSQPPNSASDDIPATSDSHLGVELDETSSASTIITTDREGIKGSREHQLSPVVFLTKTKVPDFRARRGHKEKAAREDQESKVEQERLEDTTLTQSSDVDLLPIINEEGEDTGDHARDKHTCSQSLPHPAKNPGHRGAPIKAPPHHTAQHTAGPHPHPVTLSSLDTRRVVSEATSNLPDTNDDHGNGLSTLTTSVEGRGKRGGRKTEVSYGDLVKLKHTHTSNTKRLFQLVDRLASKHGIADPPAQSPFPTVSSLDPRANDRIKMRGQAPDSQPSGGIVKQAAVFYSIKYGYNHVTDDAVLSDALPPILVSQVSANHDTAHQDISSSAVFPSLSDVIQKDNVDARSDATSLRSSLRSVRRGSMEMTSSLYTLSDVRSLGMDDVSEEWSLDKPPDGQTDRQTDRQASRTLRGQGASMSQLSQQVNQVRERNILGMDSKNPNPNPTTNPTPTNTRLSTATASTTRQRQKERRLRAHSLRVQTS